MTELPEIGDIILMEYGFDKEEFVVKKRLLTFNLLYLSRINKWFTWSELNFRKPVVIGKYHKLFWIFGYKNYKGERLK